LGHRQNLNRNHEITDFVEYLNIIHAATLEVHLPQVITARK
jgi:hypothetical protein